MKKPSAKQPRSAKNPQTAKILRSLRNARKHAVETARQHRTPIIYMKDGKLVRERP